MGGGSALGSDDEKFLAAPLGGVSGVQHLDGTLEIAQDRSPRWRPTRVTPSPSPSIPPTLTSLSPHHPQQSVKQMDPYAAEVPKQYATTQRVPLSPQRLLPVSSPFTRASIADPTAVAYGVGGAAASSSPSARRLLPLEPLPHGTPTATPRGGSMAAQPPSTSVSVGQHPSHRVSPSVGYVNGDTTGTQAVPPTSPRGPGPSSSAQGVQRHVPSPLRPHRGGVGGAAGTIDVSSSGGISHTPPLPPSAAPLVAPRRAPLLPTSPPASTATRSYAVTQSAALAASARALTAAAATGSHAAAHGEGDGGGGGGGAPGPDGGRPAERPLTPSRTLTRVFPERMSPRSRT